VLVPPTTRTYFVPDVSTIGVDKFNPTIVLAGDVDKDATLYVELELLNKVVGKPDALAEYIANHIFPVGVPTFCICICIPVTKEVLVELKSLAIYTLPVPRLNSDKGDAVAGLYLCTKSSAMTIGNIIKITNPINNNL
jgi:hypothetical protein